MEAKKQRRMALENPQSIQIWLTHPTTPERFVALESAIEEVKAKIAAGAALEPEKKPDTQPASGTASDVFKASSRGQIP